MVFYTILFVVKIHIDFFSTFVLLAKNPLAKIAPLGAGRLASLGKFRGVKCTIIFLNSKILNWYIFLYFQLVKIGVILVSN